MIGAAGAWIPAIIVGCLVLVAVGNVTLRRR